MPRENWKLVLEPFGISLAGMYEAITALGDEDLLELQEACTKPTQTNCWCFTYRAANVIRDEVETEVRQRKLIPAPSEP
jgi:hypothetical protein